MAEAQGIFKRRLSGCQMQSQALIPAYTSMSDTFLALCVRRIPRQSALAFTVLMMRLVLDGRPLHSACSALRFHLNPLSAKLRTRAPVAAFSENLDKLLPPPQHPVGCVIGFSLLRHRRIINTHW